jgi:hypothetical protein
MNYGSDPPPEGYADGRPYWSNGAAPGNVRQKRRVTLAMLNVLAHILYEGGEYEAERSGMGSTLHDPGMQQITLAVTVDKDTFWRTWARLKDERGWDV